MKNEEKLQELAEKATRIDEELKEAVCESCHWPYIEKDQEKMTERCDNCQVMARIGKALEAAFALGKGTGLCEAALLAADSQGWMEEKHEKLHQHQ